MGAEFIEKATPSFKKSWDNARVALSTADLFTQMPEIAARTAAADILGKTRLEVGDRLTIELENGGLIGRQGTRVVVRFTSPGPELIRAVAESCGIAKGTVMQAHLIAGVVEISLC